MPRVSTAARARNRPGHRIGLLSYLTRRFGDRDESASYLTRGTKRHIYHYTTARDLQRMPSRKPSDPKLETLRAQGTVNPRAADVRDPAFVDSEFFDPRDLIQVKYEMLRRVRADGHAVADAAANFGVSRPTFYKAQTDFEREGLAGLVPGKRGPRGPHKLTAKVMSFITRTVTNEPDLDAAALVERIHQKLKLHVHRRTIERALARSKKKVR